MCRNISTQHLATMLGHVVRYCEEPGQAHATYRKIVGQHMLHSIGHPVAICFNMLNSFRMANRTSAHAPVQQCYRNVAKRHTICCNRAAKRVQPVVPNNAICCFEMLRAFGRRFRRISVAPCCRQSSWPASIPHLHIQNLQSDRERELFLSPREAEPARWHWTCGKSKMFNR